MMALSRSMKNLMHESAQARRGGGNPKPTGGGMSGMISQAMQQVRDRGTRYNPGPKLQRGPSGPTRGPRGPVKPAPGGGRWGTPAGPGGPVLRPSPGRTPMTGSPRGPAGQQALIKAKMTQARQRGAGGGMMRPAVEPRKPGGTFGFAARGGGGTPALQQATAGARSQALSQRAALPGGRVPQTPANVVGTPAARARRPAALTPPRGQPVAQRVAGRQGPPASRGGMARAYGSGGSRRRMLR